MWPQCLFIREGESAGGKLIGSPQTGPERVANRYVYEKQTGESEFNSMLLLLVSSRSVHGKCSDDTKTRPTGRGQATKSDRVVHHRHARMGDEKHGAARKPSHIAQHATTTRGRRAPIARQPFRIEHAAYGNCCCCCDCLCWVLHSTSANAAKYAVALPLEVIASGITHSVHLI